MAKKKYVSKTRVRQEGQTNKQHRDAGKMIERPKVRGPKKK